MPFANYNELQAEVTDLLNRGDLAAKVPSWIVLVEKELQRILEGWQMRVEQPVTFDTSGRLALPTGFVRPVSLTLETDLAKGPIGLTTYERLQVYRGQQTSGIPQYAAVVASELVLAPVSDSQTTYTGTLIFDIQIQPLSADNPTNWVLENHPDLYLYGACVHSAPYLKNEERLSMWQGFYKDILGQIKIDRDRREFGGNTLIQRPKSALGA